MKKRIFAASMASVMALSSVSVVAFADETKDFGETVTKAELKEAIKAYDDTLKNIDNYGSVQALRFQEAYDHAAYVAADAKADADDATAAYQMLKAVAATLKQFTNEELKELIADCKATYDENNILNEEIMDNVYEEDAFLDFKNAYEDAESIVEVDDLMIVTDAYIKLDEAATALEGKKLTPVTKTQFRAIIKDYEKVLAQFSKNETWRRGKVSVKPTTGKANDGTADLDLTTAVYVTWGDLQEIVNGTSISDIVTKVNKGVADDTTAPVDTTWIAVGGTGKTVEELIYEQSKVFDDYKAASKTTDPTIKGAYDAAKEAISVFNSWKAIDADSTVKSQATKTLNSYRTQLVNDFEATLAGSLATTTGAADKLSFNDGTSDVAALKYENGKLIGQPGAAKAGCVLRIVSATGLIQLDGDDYKADEVTGTKSYTIKIAEGEDYLKYIPVRSKSITTTAQATYAADKVNAAAAALKMLETYNELSDKGSKATADDWATAFGNDTASVDDVFDLDENKTVTKPAGSAREYTLINRYLAYALQDLYPEEAAACSHTKADIKKVIEEAYDLINETGDCNIFATANAELAEARKAAVEWVREAEKDKKYKDNDADHGIFDLAGADANATEVYHTLKCAAGGKYDALDALLKEYPISYAEIAEKIVKVNADVEDGVYGEAVKKAADDVAYALSVLKVSEDGNEAFTDERAFNGYNRLRVNDDATTDEEKALKTALDTLETAMKDATGDDVVLGDLDGDGKPTAKDALLVLKAAAGEVKLTDAQAKAADFNGDGVYNAKDALAILKAYAGA